MPTEAFNETQSRLLELASATVHAGATLADKFRKMIAYIREKQMEPAAITPVLLAAGFTTSRASEIKTLSLSSDADWEPYEAGKIGFKATLEKVRESKPASKEKRGRKRVPKNELFAMICKAHLAAAKASEQKVAGEHFVGRSAMFVFPLQPGEIVHNDHLWHITITIAPKPVK